MPRLFATLLLGLLVVVPTICSAQQTELTLGGDSYVAGQTVVSTTPVANDALIAGYDVTVGSAVGGDAHLAGFNVTVPSEIAGDVYAAGFSVNVMAPVGGDITAVGNSVSVRAPATVGGNARLAGNTVFLGSPVTGAALVSAQTLTLDGAVAGDLNFFGDNVTFAPGAKVTGMLSIHAPQPITVPESVATADRVRFERLVSPDYVGEAGRTAGHVVNRFWPAFWGNAAGWLLMVVVGAGFIAWLPRLVESLRVAAERRPFRQLGLGLIAFAAVLGLVPVMVMTLIGIFLIPFVLIFAAVACGLAYLSGVYLAGWKIAGSFTTIDRNAKHLAVLVGSVVIGGLLGMVPAVGWLLTLAITVFGFGGIGLLLIVRWGAKDAARLATVSPPPAAAPAVI